MTKLEDEAPAPNEQRFISSADGSSFVEIDGLRYRASVSKTDPMLAQLTPIEPTSLSPVHLSVPWDNEDMELRVMGALVAVLAAARGLSPDAEARVMRWMVERASAPNP